MVELLSYNTVVKLEKSGFPQPETVEDYQMWYSGKTLFVISPPFRTGIKPEQWFSSYPRYSPTLAEILRQMPRADVILLIKNGILDAINPLEIAAEHWLKLADSKFL